MTEPLKKTPTITSSENGSSSRPQFSSEQLEEALKNAEWILDCAQTDFFLMDDLARFVVDNEPDVWLTAGSVDTLTLGVRRLWATPFVTSTVQTMALNFGSMPNEWQWEYDGVPVRVTIVERDYAYLKNLDLKPHLSSFFKIPNPFEKYWATRYLVK